MPLANTFTGGTAPVQWFVANTTAQIHAGGISPNDIFIQAGVTAVPAGDPLLSVAPTLFSALQANQSPY